jgi:hypothetical protein
MAAAVIIPVVAAAIQLIVPQIPTFISMVEVLIGAGNGAQKKQAVVNLATAALDGIANAGKIPSAGVTDPSLATALANKVQEVFDNPQLNPLAGTPAAKSVRAPATPAPAAAPAATPATPAGVSGNVVSGNGRSFLVLEVT